MSVFLRQRPGWQFPRAVRGEGALIWDDQGYASGGQADGRGDLVMLGPPLAIERDQVDEAVAILGDAIAAVTRAR